MLSKPYLHPKDEILATMERIYRYRMTTTSGGNISIREENGDIWITPARVDKGSLRREDIVLVRANGNAEGPHRPSSELPLHLAVYRARPDLFGIVHAHPTALVAFSLVRSVPDTRLFHQARQVCGEPGFAPYELPGSEVFGRTVAAVFAQSFDCVVLENHGIITGGAQLEEAFHRFETLEFTAKTIIKAHALGDIRYLDDAMLHLPRRRVGRLPEFERPSPSSDEKQVRRDLCDFVRRAHRQRLFISTQGTFSARLDADSFVITPYRVDRGLLEPQDLVLVSGGKAESGKQHSRAADVHEAIYRHHPEMGAVINAYPVNATAFSVTGKRLDSHTIPESYVVLRDVERIPYGLQFENPTALADCISGSKPSAILENDGVLVTGGNMLEAFDRLEVLESTAEAIIDSTSIGTLSPMSDEVIRELDRVFLNHHETPRNESTL
jgi:L-fuculose-phosphate aldolase